MTELQVTKELLDRIYHNGFINSNALAAIADQWNTLTHTALDLEKIPAWILQNTLKDTYEALYFYHKEKLVPKELSKMLLEMENFLYFAPLMENEKQETDFYYYRIISFAASALQQGFFAGSYDCAFPVLKILHLGEDPILLDLEKDRIEDLL